jgi:hypothetical protein
MQCTRVKPVIEWDFVAQKETICPKSPSASKPLAANLQKGIASSHDTSPVIDSLSWLGILIHILAPKMRPQLN